MNYRGVAVRDGENHPDFMRKRERSQDSLSIQSNISQFDEVRAE
jgi:hypothetical protein